MLSWAHGLVSQAWQGVQAGALMRPDVASVRGACGAGFSRSESKNGSVHLFATRGGRLHANAFARVPIGSAKLLERLACSCEGGVPPFLGQATELCLQDRPVVLSRTQRLRNAYAH